MSRAPLLALAATLAASPLAAQSPVAPAAGALSALPAPTRPARVAIPRFTLGWSLEQVPSRLLGESPVAPGPRAGVYTLTWQDAGPARLEQVAAVVPQCTRVALVAGPCR